MSNFKKRLLLLAASAMFAGSSGLVMAQDSSVITLDGSTVPEKSDWKKSGALELKTAKEGDRTVLDIDDQSKTEFLSLSKTIPQEMIALIKSKGFVLEITMKIYPGLNSQGFCVNIPGTLNYMFSMFANEKMQSLNVWNEQIKKQVSGKADDTDKFHTWKLVYRPPKEWITKEDKGQLTIYVDGVKSIEGITPVKTASGNYGYVSIGGVGPASKQRTGRILLEKLVFRLPGDTEKDQ